MRPEPRPIGNGAEFLGLYDDRFKTARLSVALLLPLREQTASSNAILPFLLRRSCVGFPHFTELQHRLNQLYGARIIPDVYRLGNTQALLLSAVSIDDRFALNHEKVALQCAELLQSMLFHPVLQDGAFPDSDTQQEKRCLTELIQSEINEKRLYARHRCEQILCEGEGFALNRFGTIQGVTALNPNSVADSWRGSLQSARVRVIYQGATGNDSVADAFKNGFGSLPDRSPNDIEVSSKWDESRGIREVTERMDLNQAKLVMGFRVSGTLNDRELSAMRLMNSLLGATPHSLLFKNVRERLGLCYYCSSSYDRLGRVLLVDSGVDEKNASAAKEEVLRQLDAICRGDFTEAETESARGSLISQYRTIGDSQSSLADWYIGQSLDSKISTPEMVATEILQVSRHDIINAARSLKHGAVYMLSREDGGHVNNQ